MHSAKYLFCLDESFVTLLLQFINHFLRSSCVFSPLPTELNYNKIMTTNSFKQNKNCIIGNIITIRVLAKRVNLLHSRLFFLYDIPVTINCKFSQKYLICEKNCTLWRHIVATRVTREFTMLTYGRHSNVKG